MTLAALIGRARGPRIGGVQVDVSLRESHTSRREISDSPVEAGSDVTDHTKVLPDEVSIEGVLSDTPTSITDRIRLLATGKTAQQRYRDLLELKDNAETFELITGLRSYTNMVLATLRINRSVSTGESITFNATMREIEFAESAAVTVVSVPADAPKTAPPVDRGPKPKTPAPQAAAEQSSSTLSNLTGGKQGAQGFAEAVGSLF